MSTDPKRPSIIDFELPKSNSNSNTNNNERRISVIRGRRATLVNIQRSRGSIWSMPNSGKKSLIVIPVQYENSYRIMPDIGERFMPKCVRSLIQDVLYDFLFGVKYDNNTMPNFTKVIADRIKKLVRDLCYNRFKLVCHVFVGDKSGENVSIASRCLWYPENGDTFAEATFEGETVYGIGIVYGFHFD